ncbi:MAG: hypothetical protein LBR68_01710 [Lachnoclostridium sp.]|nr:hypothetical protein [Lachnoclostridium sp.]
MDVWLLFQYLDVAHQIREQVIPVVFAVVIALGACLGAINGLLVWICQDQPFNRYYRYAVCVSRCGNVNLYGR